MTPEQLAGILERVKRLVGPAVGSFPSATMRDRARRIYEMAQELQRDLR